jgi:hypothetical protein
MRVAVLAVTVTSLIVLALAGSESAVVQGNSLLTPPSIIAKDPVAPTIKKQVTSPAKENTKASPDSERANSADNPLLGLLWLLTGSARRQ